MGHGWGGVAEGSGLAGKGLGKIIYRLRMVPKGFHNSLFHCGFQMKVGVLM